MSKAKFVNVIGLVSLALFMQRGEATTFTVGGSKGWCPPSDNGAAFNQWAEKNRFQIGDTLLFVYPSGSDSVLEVSKQDYDSCTTTSPITKYTDGHTEFKFKKSGPHYFISGNKDNCANKHEKLVVVVMADRSGSKTASSPPAPAPSVSDHEQQQPPVASPEVPPVASPPTDDGTSGMAPSAESNPPPNGAASFAMSFVGSVGAFVGSSLILAF